MEPDPGTLHDRLRMVAGQRSYRALAELTGQNTETVRRYMLGASPSIDFVASMCSQFGINADWMLTGRGAMNDRENRRHALHTSSPSDLLAAVAGALERLTDRVDRIEAYVQTTETRLRGAASAANPPAGASNNPQTHDPQAKQAGAGSTGAGDGAAAPGYPYAPLGKAEPVVRALWIAGAVPKRPRPDAD